MDKRKIYYTRAEMKKRIKRPLNVVQRSYLAGQQRQNSNNTSRRFSSRLSIERRSGNKNITTQAVKALDKKDLPRHLALESVKMSQISPSEFTRQELGDYSFERRDNKMSTRLRKLYFFAGSAIFVIACLVSAQTLMLNRRARQEVLGSRQIAAGLDEYGVQVGTGDRPAESDISDDIIYAYKVAPNLPRLIKIAKLGVNARIKQTGLNSIGNIDAPANIHDASWYNGSVLPGTEGGVSLLLGHISGWTAPGVFNKLERLQVGDRVEIEKGDGSTLDYEITQTKKLPIQQINMTELLRGDNKENSLRLMTCAGSFNRETDQFDERFVVFAKIIR